MPRSVSTPLAAGSSSAKAPRRRVVSSAWPAAGLEELGRCPACAGRARTLLYSDMPDRVFFTAPGRWTIHRCAGCGCAYLDPRPTPQTIGLAYGSYYTHGEGSAQPLLGDRAGRLRRLELRLAYGRVNQRLGYARQPSTRLGALLVPLLVRRDRELLGALRFLAAPRGLPATLLDVGCGDGGYLELMRSLGWEAHGVDPDPAAVDGARRRGLDVHQGTVADAGFAEGRFGAVTLHHSIEHVHDPGAVLAECRRVLAPGGLLVVVTPNLDSEGHRRFGVDWFHLDPPRHLVLFTPGSLAALLRATGLTEVGQLPARLRGASARPSHAISMGLDPLAAPQLRLRLRVLAWRADLLAWAQPQRAEEVALLARRPP